MKAVQPEAPIHNVYFVAQSLLRLYDLDADGRVWTKPFVRVGGFAGVFSWYLHDHPTRSAVAALEPTTLTARWPGHAREIFPSFVVRPFGYLFVRAGIG